MGSEALDLALTRAEALVENIPKGRGLNKAAMVDAMRSLAARIRGENLDVTSLPPTLLRDWVAASDLVLRSPPANRKIQAARWLLTALGAEGIVVPAQVEPERILPEGIKIGLRNAREARRRNQEERARKKREEEEAESALKSSMTEEEPEASDQRDEASMADDNGFAAEITSVLPSHEPRTTQRGQNPIAAIAPSAHMVQVYKLKPGLDPIALTRRRADNVASKGAISEFLQREIKPFWGPFGPGEVIEYGVAAVDEHGREGQIVPFPLENPTVEPPRFAPGPAPAGASVSSPHAMAGQGGGAMALVNALDEIRAIAARDRALTQEQTERLLAPLRALTTSLAGGSTTAASPDSVAVLSGLRQFETSMLDRERRIESLLLKAETLAGAAPTALPPDTRLDPFINAAADVLRSQIQRPLGSDSELGRTTLPSAQPTLNDLVSAAKEIATLARSAPAEPGASGGFNADQRDPFMFAERLVKLAKDLLPPPVVPAAPTSVPTDPNVLILTQAVQGLQTTVETLKSQGNLTNFVEQAKAIKEASALMGGGFFNALFQGIAAIVKEFAPIIGPQLSEALKAQTGLPARPAPGPRPPTSPSSLPLLRPVVAAPPITLPASATVIVTAPAATTTPVAAPVTTPVTAPDQPEVARPAAQPEKVPDQIQSVVTRMLLTEDDHERVFFWRHLTGLLSTRPDGQTFLALLQEAIKDPDHGKDNFVRLVQGLLVKIEMGEVATTERIVRLANAIDQLIVVQQAAREASALSIPAAPVAPAADPAAAEAINVNPAPEAETRSIQETETKPIQETETVPIQTDAVPPMPTTTSAA